LAAREQLSEAPAAPFPRHLAASRQILLPPPPLPLPPRLVPAPGPEADRPHRRSGYELGAVAVVTLRRVAGGLRRTLALTAALASAGLGALLLLFPRVMGTVLAVATFGLALGFGLYGLE